jgi:hypothetical protein
MSMTVKKLISELEKIENKFLEVELISPSYAPYPVDAVQVSKANKKVFLISPSHKI